MFEMEFFEKRLNGIKVHTFANSFKLDITIVDGFDGIFDFWTIEL